MEPAKGLHFFRTTYGLGSVKGENVRSDELVVGLFGGADGRSMVG